MIFTFVLFVGDLLLKWLPKHSSVEILFCFPKFKKIGMCLMEKISVLDKLRLCAVG